jgi:hypothetical protein
LAEWKVERELQREVDKTENGIEFLDYLLAMNKPNKKIF